MTATGVSGNDGAAILGRVAIRMREALIAEIRLNYADHERQAAICDGYRGVVKLRSELEHDSRQCGAGQTAQGAAGEDLSQRVP